jgi:hypothetical protein
MPLYTYENPNTGKTIELLQTMSEDHVYTDDKGVQWKRVFQVPNAAIDSQIDHNSSTAFVDATRNKKGTYGDLLDKSRELSDKRAQERGGTDPLKEKVFRDYSARRKGAKHPEQMKKFENSKVKVDY